jgi:hypothetical protein
MTGDTPPASRAAGEPELAGNPQAAGEQTAGEQTASE